MRVFCLAQNPAIRPRSILDSPKTDQYADFEKRLKDVEQAGLILASNNFIGQRIKELQRYHREFALPTSSSLSGTLVAYVAPGRTFREKSQKISSLGNGHYLLQQHSTKDRYIFPVPEEFLDAKNAILVAEHPDYSVIQEGKDHIVDTRAVNIVHSFPSCIQSEDNWFLPDPKHGLPQGNPVSSRNPDAVRFTRYGESIGPVRRNHGCGPSLRHIGLEAPVYSCGYNLLVMGGEIIFVEPQEGEHDVQTGRRGTEKAGFFESVARALGFG